MRNNFILKVTEMNIAESNCDVKLGWNTMFEIDTYDKGG